MINKPPSVLGERIYYWLGNVYRLLTSVYYQRKIHFHQAKTIFGISFDRNNPLNHLINTLKEYDSNPNIHYKETSLYSHLKNFQPTSILDWIESSKKDDLPLFSYPWGTFKIDKDYLDKDPFLSRFCGPSSDSFIEDEFIRTIQLYQKIKNEGYHPWKNYNRHIGGTFLINNQGKFFFVVLQGNHRLAILSHLNRTQKISVRNVKGYKFKIYEKNLPNWSLVKSKKCSINSAKNVFDLFFTSDIKRKILENQRTISEL